MTNQGRQQGFCLLCRPDGVVERIVRDDLELRLDCAGHHLKSLLDSGSWTKSQAFLETIRTTGAAFDCELVMNADGQPRTMYFVGGSAGQSYFICGVSSKESVTCYLDDLMRINNEQVSQVRDLVKQMVETRSSLVRESRFYDDLTRLNNELLDTQRELHKSNDQLLRLNDEKNQALGVVAHDLRNPISVLQMYTTYLRQSTAGRLNEEEREFLIAMERTTKSMSQLVNNILDVAAIESGRLNLELDRVDVFQLVRGIVARLRPLARDQNVQLSLETTHDNPVVVQADAAKLEQVFNNLIDNAVKFSSSGGVVVIAIYVEQRVARIAVQDFGPGIDESVLQTLYRPFASGRSATTSEKAGTGLGLSIARRIVEGHGGSIELQTAVGEGTTFFVILPLAD